jgi:hypothetical protein
MSRCLRGPSDVLLQTCWCAIVRGAWSVFLRMSMRPIIVYDIITACVITVKWVGTQPFGGRSEVFDVSEVIIVVTLAFLHVLKHFNMGGFVRAWCLSSCAYLLCLVASFRVCGHHKQSGMRVP